MFYFKITLASILYTAFMLEFKYLLSPVIILRICNLPNNHGKKTPSYNSIQSQWNRIYLTV